MASRGAARAQFILRTARAEQGTCMPPGLGGVKSLLRPVILGTEDVGSRSRGRIASQARLAHRRGRRGGGCRRRLVLVFGASTPGGRAPAGTPGSAAAGRERRAADRASDSG